jgi:hypothetical protein
MVVFLHVQNFMDKLPLNPVLRSHFVQLQHCDGVVAKRKCIPITN